MAGLPSAVIKRSEDLMNRMQKDFAKNLAVKKKSLETAATMPQLSLFESEESL